MASVGQQASASKAAAASAESARGALSAENAKLAAELAAAAERAGRAETVVTSLQEQLDQAHEITAQQGAQLEHVSFVGSFHSIYPGKQ